MADQPHKIARLTPELRENFVAYLDGELDEAGTRAIERVLESSPIAKHDLEMLSRTVDMLDALPKATPSETFTQQTMETIRLEEVPPVPLSSRPWFGYVRRGIVGAVWLAALAAAAAVGFLLTYQWIPRQSDGLVRDLGVVEQLEAYRTAGDIRFLQELERRDLFSGEETRP
jgi:anti-sigma factor RsiW